MSVRNAYIGSHIDPNSPHRYSVGAGLNRNAIFKIELDPSAGSASGWYGTRDDNGNPIEYAADNQWHNVALTGMIQYGDRGSAEVVIIADQFFDQTLDDLEEESTNMNIPGTATPPGITATDWVPFSITIGQIRRPFGEDFVEGHDGASGSGETHYIFYEMTVNGDTTESPYSQLNTPAAPAPIMAAYEAETFNGAFSDEGIADYTNNAVLQSSAIRFRERETRDRSIEEAFKQLDELPRSRSHNGFLTSRPYDSREDCLGFDGECRFVDGDKKHQRRLHTVEADLVFELLAVDM